MFDRITQLDRAREDVGKTGLVSGILATGGEASDGHILDIAGGKVKRGAPLLFNHDAYDGNLGSWVDFDASGGALRGTAQIELDGIGDRAAWRKDVAHMVGKGHIGAFSIRWDSDSEPTRRTDLPREHPAFVDRDHESDLRKLYGLHFDEWHMIEGSVVSTPADEGALIGRMREASSAARNHWSRVLARVAGAPFEAPESKLPLGQQGAIIDAFKHIGLDELEKIQLYDGRDYYVPREIAERMTIQPEESVTPLGPERDGETPAPTTEVTGVTDLDRDDLVQLMREEVGPTYKLMREEWRDLLYDALGRV